MNLSTISDKALLVEVRRRGLSDMTLSRQDREARDLIRRAAARITAEGKPALPKETPAEEACRRLVCPRCRAIPGRSCMTRDRKPTRAHRARIEKLGQLKQG